MNVPNFVRKSWSWQNTVKSYSPGWIVVCKISAASLRETPSEMMNGLVVEKVLFSVVVMTVPSGKVGFVAPTGPVTSMSALLDSGLQPAEVVAVMICVSRPVVGVKVSVPRVPGAGAASAPPLRSNVPPVVTATTRLPETSRVKNLLHTIVFISGTLRLEGEQTRSSHRAEDGDKPH